MSDDLRRRCGVRLCDLRTGKGWSQTRLATLVGKSQSSVYKWENGITEPSLAIRRRFVDLFGSDPFAITPDEAVA